jgi:hypothetical protein
MKLPMDLTDKKLDLTQCDPPDKVLDILNEVMVGQKTCRKAWHDIDAVYAFYKANDLEAIFCVALLNALDTRQVQKVLECYIKLRDDAHNTLVSIGRR